MARVKRILVTGASGFVGRRLCQLLLSRGLQVRGAARASSQLISGVERCEVGNIDADTDWRAALSGVDAVVHLAARVHVMDDRAADPLGEFRRVNVDGAVRLAEAAIAAGVPRLVFVSSVKVNGEATDRNRPFREDDRPAPEDCYGMSKREAEDALRALGARIETVIVRPPLVYGPGVKANFLQLMKAINKGLPFPLASINNRRSLLFVGNLADALALCCEHPLAANQTFLLSDAAVSTPGLIKQIGIALNRPARLLPCPSALLKAVGKLTGRAATVDRLVQSLVVDGSKISGQLSWQPPFSFEQGILETARWFRESF